MQTRIPHHYQFRAKLRLALSIAALIALAVSMRFIFNHTVAAQQASEGRAAVSPTEPQQTGPTLDDRFAAVARMVPSFGGLFLDREGRLNVYLTNPAQMPAALQAIIAVFGRERLPLENAVALQGRYGFLQLKGWHDAHRFRTLAMPGALSVDIDERNNRLQIEVRDITALQDVRNELYALGIPAEGFNIEIAAPAVVQQTLQEKQRPVAGGVQISNSQGFCTLSFLAVRQGQAGFVTCSHCTSNFGGGVNNTVIHQATAAGSGVNRIGVESVDPLFFTGNGCPSGRKCRYSDSAFIRRDGGTSQTVPLTEGAYGALLIADKPDVGTPIKYWITAQADFSIAGELVEKVGRTTGRTKGAVISTGVDVNQNQQLANGNSIDLGLTMLDQYRVGALSMGGDSGSPVFTMEALPGGGTSARVHGIVWGADAQSFYYSPISQVLWGSELGSLKLLKTQSTTSAPEVKIRKPLDGSKVKVGGLNNVTFQADAVDYESNDFTLTWSSDVEGVMGTGTSLPYSFNTPGPRQITVTMKDSEGLVAQDKITITVDSGTAPEMTIVNPFANQTLYKGVTYNFNGKSYDPDEVGGVLPCSSLAWSAKNNTTMTPQQSLGSGCSIPASFSVNGDYTITLTGTDSAGGKGSTSVNVKVVDAPATGKPIVAIITPNENDMLLEGTSYAFKGTATDPEGKSMTFKWQLELAGATYDLKTGTVASGQQMNFNWTPTKQALGHTCKNYLATLKLKVTDPDGNTGIAVKLIYINFGPC